MLETVFKNVYAHIVSVMWLQLQGDQLNIAVFFWYLL